MTPRHLPEHRFIVQYFCWILVIYLIAGTALAAGLMRVVRWEAQSTDYGSGSTIVTGPPVVPHTGDTWSVGLYPPPTVVASDNTDWHSYIQQLDNVGENEKRWLIAVMECESGGRADAREYGGSTHYGLFQFDQYYWDRYVETGQCYGSIWDGSSQVACALYKYRRGGAGLWTASKHCWIGNI